MGLTCCTVHRPSHFSMGTLLTRETREFLKDSGRYLRTSSRTSHAFLGNAFTSEISPCIIPHRSRPGILRSFINEIRGKHHIMRDHRQQETVLLLQVFKRSIEAKHSRPGLNLSPDCLSSCLALCTDVRYAASPHA